MRILELFFQSARWREERESADEERERHEVLTGRSVGRGDGKRRME